jgi:hypothetical protein
MMLKTPIGVGWSGTPVETGPCATGTPLLNSVTLWLSIETTICSGPFGISPKLAALLLGSPRSGLLGAVRARRLGAYPG